MLLVTITTHAPTTLATQPMVNARSLPSYVTITTLVPSTLATLYLVNAISLP
jgi:hypothetical protein